MMRWRLAVAGIALSGGVGGYLVGEGAPWLGSLAYVALVGPWWVRRCPAFAADGTAFTTVASSWYAGLFAGSLALTVSQARSALAMESGPDEVSAAMFGVLAVIVIALAVLVAWRRPSLSLTPHGAARLGG